MNTLLFLLFCLAIGYVCIWVLVNERKGNDDGEWGFIAMRRPSQEPGRVAGNQGPSRDIRGGNT